MMAVLILALTVAPQTATPQTAAPGTAASQNAVPGAAEPGRDLTPAERGRKYLTQTAFIPAFWPKQSYELAWKTWGVPAKPHDYDAAFRERYGLAPAPYDNNGLPMGLRSAPYLPLGRGLGIDCMTCHGGNLFGQGVIGLGNNSLDIQALFEELAAAVDAPVRLPFNFCQVRGTNEAGAFSVYLLGARRDDLSLSETRRDLGLHDDSCEDVPAWWLLKKKKTMYHVGGTDARSVRSIMQFMMHPLTLPSDFHQAENKFQEIQQYLLSIQPPKYPFPIDAQLAAEGREVFQLNCARCHGTYGEQPTYPNKIIPLNEIGTDPKRYHNINEKFIRAYNASWFAQDANVGQAGDRQASVGQAGVGLIRETVGYQAPPLDGIWATAPYFHNGSVPTLSAVLNSKARPRVFTRSFANRLEDYDRQDVGWKWSVPPAGWEFLAPFERRKIYDTTQPGRGNQGHLYGDDLTDRQRMALIEYLKTL